MKSKAGALHKLSTKIINYLIDLQITQPMLIGGFQYFIIWYSVLQVISLQYLSTQFKLYQHLYSIYWQRGYLAILVFFHPHILIQFIIQSAYDIVLLMFLVLLMLTKIALLFICYLKQFQNQKRTNNKIASYLMTYFQIYNLIVYPFAIETLIFLIIGREDTQLREQHMYISRENVKSGFQILLAFLALFYTLFSVFCFVFAEKSFSVGQHGLQRNSVTKLYILSYIVRIIVIICHYVAAETEETGIKGFLDFLVILYLTLLIIDLINKLPYSSLGINKHYILVIGCGYGFAIINPFRFTMKSISDEYCIFLLLTVCPILSKLFQQTFYTNKVRQGLVYIINDIKKKPKPRLVNQNKPAYSQYISQSEKPEINSKIDRQESMLHSSVSQGGFQQKQLLLNDQAISFISANAKQLIKEESTTILGILITHRASCYLTNCYCKQLPVTIGLDKESSIVKLLISTEILEEFTVYLIKQQVIEYNASFFKTMEGLDMLVKYMLFLSDRKLYTFSISIIIKLENELYRRQKNEINLFYRMRLAHLLVRIKQAMKNNYQQLIQDSKVDNTILQVDLYIDMSDHKNYIYQLLDECLKKKVDSLQTMKNGFKSLEDVELLTTGYSTILLQIENSFKSFINQFPIQKNLQFYVYFLAEVKGALQQAKMTEKQFDYQEGLMSRAFRGTGLLEIFSNEIFYLNVSLGKSTGKILGGSSNLLKIFGFKKSEKREFEMLQHVKDLMPLTIAQFHDDLIDYFMETGKDHIVHYLRYFLLRNKQNFIIQVQGFLAMNMNCREELPFIFFGQNLAMTHGIAIVSQKKKVTAFNRLFLQNVGLRDIDELRPHFEFDIKYMLPDFDAFLNQMDSTQRQVCEWYEVQLMFFRRNNPFLQKICPHKTFNSQGGILQGSQIKQSGQIINLQHQSGGGGSGNQSSQQNVQSQYTTKTNIKKFLTNIIITKRSLPAFTDRCVYYIIEFKSIKAESASSVSIENSQNNISGMDRSLIANNNLPKQNSKGLQPVEELTQIHEQTSKSSQGQFSHQYSINDNINNSKVNNNSQIALLKQSPNNLVNNPNNNSQIAGPSIFSPNTQREFNKQHSKSSINVPSPIQQQQIKQSNFINQTSNYGGQHSQHNQQKLPHLNQGNPHNKQHQHQDQKEDDINQNNQNYEEEEKESLNSDNNAVTNNKKKQKNEAAMRDMEDQGSVGSSVSGKNRSLQKYKFFEAFEKSSYEPQSYKILKIMKFSEILLLIFVGMIQLIIVFQQNSYFLDELHARFFSTSTFSHYSNILALQRTKIEEYYSATTPTNQSQLLHQIATILQEKEAEYLKAHLNEQINNPYLNPYLTSKKLQFYDTFKKQVQFQEEVTIQHVYNQILVNANMISQLPYSTTTTTNTNITTNTVDNPTLNLNIYASYLKANYHLMLAVMQHIESDLTANFQMRLDWYKDEVLRITIILNSFIMAIFALGIYGYANFQKLLKIILNLITINTIPSVETEIIRIQELQEKLQEDPENVYNYILSIHQKEGEIQALQIKHQQDSIQKAAVQYQQQSQNQQNLTQPIRQRARSQSRKYTVEGAGAGGAEVGGTQNMAKVNDQNPNKNQPLNKSNNITTAAFVKQVPYHQQQLQYQPSQMNKKHKIFVSVNEMHLPLRRFVLFSVFSFVLLFTYSLTNYFLIIDFVQNFTEVREYFSHFISAAWYLSAINSLHESFKSYNSFVRFSSLNNVFSSRVGGKGPLGVLKVDNLFFESQEDIVIMLQQFDDIVGEMIQFQEYTPMIQRLQFFKKNSYNEGFAEDFLANLNTNLCEPLNSLSNNTEQLQLMNQIFNCSGVLNGLLTRGATNTFVHMHRLFNSQKELNFQYQLSDTTGEEAEMEAAEGFSGLILSGFIMNAAYKLQDEVRKRQDMFQNVLIIVCVVYQLLIFIAYGFEGIKQVVWMKKRFFCAKKFVYLMPLQTTLLEDTFFKMLKALTIKTKLIH